MSTGDNNQNGYYRTDNTVFDDLNLDNANIDIDWDTFTLDTSSMGYNSHITYSNFQTSVGSGNVTISNGGTGWASQPYSLPDSTTTYKSNVVFEGDVKIKGRNLAEVLDTICDRLAILTPDPEKLEKHEALRKAYEHYKTLERLIGED